MPLMSEQPREVHESLEQFGLSSSERDAYIALLPMGLTQASPLAKKMKLPLSTVQSLLQRLNILGIIQITRRGSRNVYQAKNPAVLKSLLEQKIRDISGALPLLAQMYRHSDARVKLRLYERDRISDILQQALECKGKLVHEFVSAADFQKLLGERFHFTRRRLAQGIRLKSLRVEAHEIKKYSRSTHAKEMREAKFLPREFSMRCSIMFWDNTVAFFTAADEGLAWTIESASVRELAQQFFDVFWSLGRRMETAT